MIKSSQQIDSATFFIGTEINKNGVFSDRTFEKNKAMTHKINSKPFILHSDFAPAGDQPQAIAKLIENLNDGLAHQTLLGVTGSGKTFTIANVIAQLNRPAMVLAPNKTLAAQLYAEMKAGAGCCGA